MLDNPLKKLAWNPKMEVWKMIFFFYLLGEFPVPCYFYGAITLYKSPSYPTKENKKDRPVSPFPVASSGWDGAKLTTKSLGRVMVTSSSIKKINIPRIWNLKSIQSMNFHCNRHRISTLLKVVFFLVVKLYGFGLMRGKKLRHHKVRIFNGFNRGWIRSIAKSLVLCLGSFWNPLLSGLTLGPAVMWKAMLRIIRVLLKHWNSGWWLITVMYLTATY